MLYHIVIMIIFAVLAYAVIVLFRKYILIQKRRKERQLKESEFMSKLVSGGELRPEQLSKWYDFDEDRTINKDVSELKTTDTELDGKDIRAIIIKEINCMSDMEIRQFYQEFQERQHDRLRKHDRKNFFMIIDYNVNDQYHRDFIQDISESGVFIKTSQTFSIGQKIQMTFMSPDYQKPFKIKGEIVRTHTDGVGVKFIIDSQVQESALKSFMSNIQRETVGTQ
ncbi:MAG: PilZ domain-containing protein [Desulfobacterales bacterium]|jgi:Tfp pilus assembly protein PilZ